MVFTYDPNATVQYSTNQTTWTTIANWVSTTVNSDTVYYQFFTFNTTGINQNSGITQYNGDYTQLLADLGSDVLVIHNPYIVQNGTDHDISVSAIWKVAETVTVTFNSNGGTGTMNDQTFTEGTTQQLNANQFVRPNYTFIGWSTSPTATTAEYTDEEAISIVGNKVLYAIWQPDASYTVTFNNNGGSGTMTDQTFIGGESQQIKANTFTRTGYVFRGWATSANATTAVYTDEESIVATENMELYAVWKRQYTITFNRNRGTGTMQNQIFVEDEPQALTTNTFTRRRYTFSGWATSANGSVVYTDGQTITVTENMTLYAVWTR